MRGLRWVAFGAMVASACGFEISLEGKVCDEAGQCANGYVCVEGNCLRRGPGNTAVSPDGAPILLSEDGSSGGDPEAGSGSDASGSQGDSGGGGEDSGALPLTVNWTKEDSPTAETLYGVVALGNGVAVAVGANGTVLRRNALGVWLGVTSATTKHLFGVAHDGPDVWAVGASGAVVHSPSQGASFFAETSGTASDLRAAAVVGGQVFVGGNADVFLRGPAQLGTTFTTVVLQIPSATESVNAIFAPATDHVKLFTSTGRIHLYQGPGILGFQVGPGSPDFAAASGLADKSCWAVGSNRVIAYEDVGKLYAGTDLAPPNSTKFRGVWADSSSLVVAVGEFGVIKLSSGTGWITEGSGTPEDLNAVSGAGSEIYAVGNLGTILKRK